MTFGGFFLFSTRGALIKLFLAEEKLKSIFLKKFIS